MPGFPPSEMLQLDTFSFQNTQHFSPVGSPILCNKINYGNITLNTNRGAVKWTVLLSSQDDYITTTSLKEIEFH